MTTTKDANKKHAATTTNSILSLDWKDTQTLSYSICLSWCDSKQKLILWSRKSINLDSLCMRLCECDCQIGVCVYRIWLKNRLKRSNFFGRCTWICLRKFAIVCWLCWRSEQKKIAVVCIETTTATIAMATATATAIQKALISNQ